MKYGIQIPSEWAEAAEEVWKEKLIQYDVMSTGCGTVEFTFRYATIRETAVQLLKDTLDQRIGYFKIHKGEVIREVIVDQLALKEVKDA